MKFLVYIFLTALSLSANTAPSELLTKELIDTIKLSYPEVDSKIFVDARNGDITSALEASGILFRLNSESMANKGILLLESHVNKYQIARLYLGIRYLEGVEIMPPSEKPRRVLVDYDKAIKNLISYLENPISNNDKLSLIAFATLGSAYIKNENYDQAAAHFLNNIKLVDADPTGHSAYELAGLYRDGNGIKEDKEEAFFWYDASAKKGFNMAIMERNFLAIELGKE
jgi:TPR repeat protein